MAVDPTRAAIEFMREVIKVAGFLLTGYSIDPASVTLTLMRDIKGTAESERILIENRLRILLESYAWNVISSQVLQDSLIVTAQRPRTLTGII